MSNGFVYFLHAVGTDRYKIGLTNDIDRRLKELNGKQAAFEVKLLWSIAVSDMRAAESWLHDKFSDRRVHGEWFQFDDDELSQVRELYIDAGNHFGERVYQTVSNDPGDSYYDFELPEIGTSFGQIVVALGAIGVIGAFFYAAVNSSSSPSFGRTAIVNQLSNVRETPNGKIICTVPKGKQITIESYQSQWLKTSDACDRPGVIFKSLVEEQK